jgi:hypothetical protein
MLHRLGNEGRADKWRIVPEAETGVTDPDFYFGQAAFRKASTELGMNPDDLQGLLWFAEKDYWSSKGWTRGAGAEKGDFNTFLTRTRRDREEIVLDAEQSLQQELDL